MKQEDKTQNQIVEFRLRNNISAMLSRKTEPKKTEFKQLIRAWYVM
jgi:hypothetical protein